MLEDFPYRLLLATCVTLALVPNATRAADRFEPLREKIRRELEQRKLPSLAVAVARGDEILWQEGFGWADRERQVPADEHTVYSLASISKPVTATAIMVLVERAALDLDRPADAYLGEAKLTARVGDAAEATLRRLATHTAGLPLHYQFFYEDEDYRKPSMDESIRRYGHLLDAPGGSYQYANFGYGLLDYIVQRASGCEFGEFVEQEVFEPLGMDHSSVHLAERLKDRQAVRYDGDGKPIPYYDFDHVGASAVYSCAHDLVRFGMFHLKQRLPEQKAILCDASIDAMQQGGAELGGGRHYGLGWFVDHDEYGYRTVSHTGGMGGVRTRLVLVPDEQLAVVALCNASDNLPIEMTQEILAVLLPQYAERLHPAEQADDTGAGGGAEPVEQEVEVPGLPETLVGHWSGTVDTYQGSRPLQLWVSPDGKAQVALNGQPRAVLDEFRFEESFITGAFAGDVQTEDASRRAHRVHLKLRIDGHRLVGAATAISLPGRRAGNALSYWASLEKQPDDPAPDVEPRESLESDKPERQEKEKQETAGKAAGKSLFNGTDLTGWRVADENFFERHGEVTVQDGEIRLSQGQPATGIVWKGEFPRDRYEVTLEARRIEGGDFFCGMTFPVADAYCTLILGGWGGGVIGLSNVDDMSAVENDTTDYQMFQQKQWYQVRLRVSPEKIEAWIDDDQVVELKREDRKFSIWWEQEPMRPFGIASWNTTAGLRNIRVRQ